LTVIVGVFIFVNTHPIRPHDFWWHAAVGREIATSGVIPLVDQFSFTAYGLPYPSYQMFWLMDVLLYTVLDIGGPALVVFVQSLIITSTYLLVFWICFRLTKNWRLSAFSTLFAAALGINDWNVRPQAIAFLLGALYLWAIYEYRNHPRWGYLVLFPIGMLLWVNSHGTFIIGLVLLGIWLLDELWRVISDAYIWKREYDLRKVLPPLVSIGITLITCFFNPRGFGIIQYISTLTGNVPIQSLVTEWTPPVLGTLNGTLFYVGLLIAATILAISPKRPAMFQLITFVLFAVLGVRTSRGIIWFGLVMAPILADHVNALLGQYGFLTRSGDQKKGSTAVNLIFVCVLLLLALISLPWFKNSLPLPTLKAGLVSFETPVRATEFLLNEGLPDQVFHSMSFGSYLIWEAHSDYQVFVDPRIELYPVNIWLDYLNIGNVQGDWEAKLNDYGVNTLMLSPYEHAGLIGAANDSSGWDMIYEDASAVIFIRGDS
jgi:hypothetical protein